MTFQRTFSFLAFITVFTASIAAQTELVKNGNFSSGTTNWTLNQYGGSSSGSVQSGEYRLVITAAGTEHWHVQFIQTALALVQGKSYTFAFDAYKGTQNSGTQSMQVNIGQSQSPYTSYFGGQANMVTLTTTKTRYTYTINMTSASDQNARIEFNCGKSTGGFYIDNVSLAEAVTGPHLSAVPLTVNFGVVLAGATGTANVTLQNNGGSAATVSAVQSSSGIFSTTLTVPATVAAAGSLTLPVRFTPVAAGAFSGTVTVYSNATDNPTITITCSGTSVLPGLQFTPASISFSAAPGEAVSQTITLSNTASTPISWGLASSSAWATVTPTSGTIAAGAQVVCNVTASHATTGTYNSTLTLTHSASNIPSPTTIPVSLTVSAGYQPTCPYIQNPETAIDFIRDLAAFRMRQRDNTNGGFFTNIDRQGNSTGANEKALCGQSRIAYAFVRAFMVTGEEQYLEYAHHALKFLYDHGWNNGWYFVTDIDGDYVSHWGHNDWWSFQQHYALVGISAMVEATGGKMNWNDGSESDHTWLMRGVNLNYTKLWDSNPTTKGYFDRANTAWTSKWGKGFHATVDGITTHALLMRMMYDSLNHRNRFVELSDNVANHLIGGMAQAAAGFPEVYNADWSVDNSVVSMDIGHGFKTAWVLQRAYLLHPDHPEYLTAAQAIMQNLWDNGCYDEVYGAPYSYLNWQTGEITGTNKDFWMVEQGFTSGMMSYYTAQTQELRDRYMFIADGSLNFFMDHLMDPVYGESYNVVSRDGSTVVDPNKGGLFTAGYHSVELGYYTYLYSSLYYHKTPVQLYYYYPVENVERTFKLTPVAIEDEVLKILSVTLDGAVYTDFNTNARTVHLPAGVGGKLKVTFGFTSAVTHVVSASAGGNGTISPSGQVAVIEGGNQTFTITPAAGYRVSDVLVDGVSAGAVLSYTFTNVTAAHTIAAAFAPVPTYTITASAGAGGSISPSGAVTVLENQSATFTITPAAGYRVSDVLIDGASVGAVLSYTFTNVTAAHTIAAAFASVPTYTITASAGAGGSIAPSGTVTVIENQSATFTLTPAAGYRVSDVLVDGVSAGAVSSYTFTNVTTAHTIAAAFSPLPTYTITATAGAGGAISPSGATSVVQGASQAYAITPSSGYRIAGVLVDGVSAGTVSTYTFTNVTAAHTISATFSLIPATVHRINCGSTSAASPFTADQYASGGTQHSVTNAITITGITSPAPQVVYQSERYGTSTYTLPGLTTGASYTVRLHFAELYQTATGRRVFNVAINGTTVLSNFDVYAAAGARYKAVLREFTATANASGQIVINFTTVTDNATISGIEIIPAVPNDPPTIATAASATPGVVAGTTTALSVLGADDNGESALAYTWATTGTPPAAVTFSANGTNAAKATTATFTKAGSYTLQATIRDAGNLTVTSTVAVTVNQTFTSVVVSPSSASVATSATQQFTATARDQFSTNLTTQPTFTWSVSGGGTVSAGGLFTAGTASGGPYTVTATSGGVSATAAVTVTAVVSPTYRINCGSASAASPFTADQYASGGTQRTVTNAITITGITSPAPQAVYQSERYGASTYTLPGLAAGASYTVRLHFAELYQTATGRRVFNVGINGTTVLSNFDIYAVAGARYKAVLREFTAAANASGQIVINLTTVTDNATINGIEVIRN